MFQIWDDFVLNVYFSKQTLNTTPKEPSNLLLVPTTSIDLVFFSLVLTGALEASCTVICYISSSIEVQGITSFPKHIAQKWCHLPHLERICARVSNSVALHWFDTTQYYVVDTLVQFIWLSNRSLVWSKYKI